MNSNDPRSTFVSKNIETYLKTAIIFLIIYASFLIFKPFLLPIVWGAILAMALYPLHVKFSKLLGNRPKLSAVLITLFLLALVIIPAKSFFTSLFQEVKVLAEMVKTNTLAIQPPPEKVAEWPLVGESIYKAWDAFATNFEKAISTYGEQLKGVAQWTYQTLMGVTGTVLIFIIAIIISGVFLNISGKGFSRFYKIGEKLVGDKGNTIVNNIVKTIRSVMTGVLGTAVLQSIIVCIPLFLFHVPGAPILAVVVLFMAIAQLPIIILAIPIIIYMFSVLSGFSAVIFAIWLVVGAASDNIFKPILLGRGMNIPMFVILIGAIGGMLLMGIIGLFIGAVILAVAYELMQLWLQSGREDEVQAETTK